MAKRHPLLIGLVFVFALFLAAAPFFFGVERSPYTEALTLYDRLCLAADSGDVAAFRSGLSARFGSAGQLDAALLMSRLKCVNRMKCRTTFEPIPGRAWGANRSYTLTLFPKSGKDAIRMNFTMENEVLKWSP
ncbi:MAG: hypothetical protein GXP54_13835 [Deltaproteobacteria bacterium]|nr:hypothetical protein [Deltaproteobacteria bacterium]